MLICIFHHLSFANSTTPSTSALVIGAGSMAGAAIYALLRLDVQHIPVWDRTVITASMTAWDFNKLFPPKALAPEPRVRVLESLDVPWPEGVQQLSIMICTIPAYEVDGVPGLGFEIPQPWFKSTTGGIIIDVSLFRLTRRTITDSRFCSSTTKYHGRP